MAVEIRMNELLEKIAQAKEEEREALWMEYMKLQMGA